ncbi:polyprenyl diphosphate synthase [Francisellaceae bacterium CB299]|jgi:undecaprenyl diphosphate synthase
MSLVDKNLLKHIAIIMDGNGRWAKSRFKPRIFGHRNSIKSVDAVIEYCVENSIEILTLFAFGRDNWSRPEAEVADLMELFYKTLDDKTPKLHKNNVRLKVVGDKSRLSQKLLQKIYDSESFTAGNTGMELRLAVDYAGKWDILQAVKRLISECDFSKDDAKNLKEEDIASKLLAGIAPIDLMIRTSGEVRLSDFMLWQLAYAEMYFTDVMWPDFSKKEMQKAVDCFYRRQRRFGKSSEQILN